MYLYHLSDAGHWYDHYVYKTLRKAREVALSFMDQAAWAHTPVMYIRRIDTKTETITDCEYVVHGAHRAEAHKCVDQ